VSSAFTIKSNLLHMSVILILGKFNIFSFSIYYQAFIFPFMIMSQQETIPYGKRLIPPTIDEIARDGPERIYFSISQTSDLSDGFRDITFKRFANTINRTAWFIESTIGRSSAFETILYMGAPDIRHYVLVAAMKTGHKVRSLYE